MEHKTKPMVLVIDDDPNDFYALTRKNDLIDFEWLPNIYFCNDLIGIRPSGYYDLVVVDINGTDLAGSIDDAKVDRIHHDNVLVTSGVHPITKFDNFVSKESLRECLTDRLVTYER